MTFAGPKLFRALVAGLVLASCAAATAAITRADREVQVLASFPNLQKLGRDEGALRAFLVRVSDTYKKMGYADFARELRRSASLLVLFGQPERGAKASALQRARAALRKLEQALAKNRFVALPAIGDTAPDYYGIAGTFLNAAGIALKNLSLDKNVADTLRNNKGSLWLTNNGDNNFTLSGGLVNTDSGTLNFNISPGNTSDVIDGGRLILSGNTYTGATTVNSGTLINLGIGSGSSISYSSGFSAVTGSGSILTTPPFSTPQKYLAFRPGDLPEGLVPRIYSTLQTPYVVSADVTLPTGTEIVSVATSFVAPDNAVVFDILPADMVFVPLTRRIFLFPAGVVIPSRVVASSTLTAYVPMLVNGVEYAPSIRIVETYSLFDPPAEAIELHDPYTVVPAPTPTPSPTPAE